MNSTAGIMAGKPEKSMSNCIYSELQSHIFLVIFILILIKGQRRDHSLGLNNKVVLIEVSYTLEGIHVPSKGSDYPNYQPDHWLQRLSYSSLHI